MASIVYDVTLDQARAKFGRLAVTATEAFGICVALWLRRTAIDRFDEIAAAQLIAQLPVYDAAALLRACPVDQVATLLQTLLRDGVPLVDFRLIAPLLADERRVGWTEKDRVTATYPGRLLVAAPRPEDAAERRRVIARSIAVSRWLRLQAGAEPLQVWVLDEIGGWLPPDGAASEELSHFDAQLLAQVEPAAAVDDAILLTSPARRAYIAERLHPHYPYLTVAGVHELPRGVRIQRRGTVCIQPPARDKSASRNGS